VAPQAAASQKPLKQRATRVDFRGGEAGGRLRRARLREVWMQAYLSRMK
jgi:hypothetical protein